MGSCYCSDCRCDTVDVAAPVPRNEPGAALTELTSEAGKTCQCYPANDTCPSAAACHSVYIAGPMTGIEEYNYPAFNDAAARWRERGWRVFNPAEHELPTVEQEAALSVDEIRALYMRKDIEWVMESDAVALLPGWQNSKGAQAEVTVARVLNLDLYDADTFAPYAETVLDEASRVTSVDRQAVYGHPAEDFGRTAAFWTIRFAHKLKEGESFTAEDVPPAMRLVKESRLVNTPRHRDSLVDISGYARTQEMVWDY